MNPEPGIANGFPGRTPPGETATATASASVVERLLLTLVLNPSRGGADWVWGC